jgi:hypothetical protein
MTQWNTANIRELLNAAFNDEELQTFCFDYFRSVYDNFGGGTSKGDKIQSLLDYCERENRIPDLLARVRHAKPTKYAEFESGLKSSESPPPIVPSKNPHKSGWRNWGDRIIVLIGVTAALLGIIVFLTGAPDLRSLLFPTPTSFVIPRDRLLIEKLSFDYSDSPEDHGWIILDQPQPTYNHISSGFVGNALEIKSYEGRALDFPIGAASSFGTMIEYVAKFEGNAAVYTYVKVQSKDGSTSRKVWFAFVPGTKKPEQVYAPPEEEEWTVYVKPEQLGGGWLSFRIDLEKIVTDTVGTEGWRLEQLLKFRLRGNLGVASISIYE